MPTWADLSLCTSRSDAMFHAQSTIELSKKYLSTRFPISPKHWEYKFMQVLSAYFSRQIFDILPCPDQR